jgi:hypothetical protein
MAAAAAAGADMERIFGSEKLTCHLCRCDKEIILSNRILVLQNVVSTASQELSKRDSGGDGQRGKSAGTDAVHPQWGRAG